MFYLRHELPLDRCPSCSVNKPRIALIGKHETADYSGLNKRFWNVYQCSTCGGLVVAYSHQTHADAVIEEIFPKPTVVADDIPDREREHISNRRSTVFIAQPAL